MLYTLFFLAGIAFGGMTVGILLQRRQKKAVDQLTDYHYRMLYNLSTLLPDDQKEQLRELVKKEYGHVNS